MHVTLVSGINPSGPQVGGTRSYVLGLAERLPTRDVSVSLVARDGGTSPVPGIDYLPIRSGPSSVQFLVRLFMSAPSLAIPRDSIIHVQRPDDLVAFSFAKRRNPTVCTLHGVPPVAIRRRKGAGYGFLYAVLERIGLCRTDRAIAVDPATAKWYRDRYPWLAARISVVPVAVDTRRFRPMDREASRARYGVRAEHVVLFAGRLSPEKRVEALIRAIPRVPHAELLIAGEGPEEDRLRELAGASPVRFLGAVPHEEMPHLLNAADLLVLPSEYEGLPTVVLEAFACGVPVVATSVGGIPDLVIPGKTGWLLEDLRSLGDTLGPALASAPLLRDSCRAAAEGYSWDAVLDRIVAVYREAGAA
ncbi:MAG TPA: glycosyltransferase family 4 protein [Thermoplasmata archaeon]|nr:glycosyltransferase family 4 protein [Thermoplasmata archaeon]